MFRFVNLGNHYINVQNILRITVSQTSITEKTWQTEIILKEYLRVDAQFGNPRSEDTIGYNNRIIEYFNNEDSAHSYAKKIIRESDGKLP